MGLLSPRVLHWKDKPPGHLALKTSGACLWKSQSAVETEIPLLKGMHKSSHALSPSAWATT